VAPGPVAIDDAIRASVRSGCCPVGGVGCGPPGNGQDPGPCASSTPHPPPFARRCHRCRLTSRVEQGGQAIEKPLLLGLSWLPCTIASSFTEAAPAGFSRQIRRRHRRRQGLLRQPAGADATAGGHSAIRAGACSRPERNAPQSQAGHLSSNCWGGARGSAADLAGITRIAM